MGAAGLDPGTEFDGYRIDRVIGRGGMGRVYRARDRQRGREVAVKMLDVPGLVADEVMRARFTRKARIATTLDHPHIVKTLDTFTEHDRRLGIVMEFVEGTSLQQLMRQVRLAPRDAVSVALALLDALAYLDERGVVRLDLKPSSIVIQGSSDPVIVDLGLAKHERSETAVTQAGDQLVGTPAYLAPEVVTGGTVDGRADVFTVGMLLFEMLSGRPARPPGELFEVLRAAVDEDVDVDSLEPASPELRGVMRRMLARDVDERYESAAAARQALAAAPEAGPA